MLKNYTSKVPASKSIQYITNKLVLNGARKIQQDYSVDGRLVGIAFIIEVAGREIPFKLPARIAECEKVLLGMKSARTLRQGADKIPAQAERTAWKIISDWVEAQMAMIELAQVEMMEVFLPYVYDAAKDQTFFESLRASNFKHLTLAVPGKGSKK